MNPAFKTLTDHYEKLIPMGGGFFDHNKNEHVYYFGQEAFRSLYAHLIHHAMRSDFDPDKYYSVSTNVALISAMTQCHQTLKGWLTTFEDFGLIRVTDFGSDRITYQILMPNPDDVAEYIFISFNRRGKPVRMFCIDDPSKELKNPKLTIQYDHECPLNGVFNLTWDSDTESVAEATP